MPIEEFLLRTSNLWKFRGITKKKLPPRNVYTSEIIRKKEMQEQHFLFILCCHEKLLFYHRKYQHVSSNCFCVSWNLFQLHTKYSSHTYDRTRITNLRNLKQGRMATERDYLSKEWPTIKTELNLHTCMLGYANFCFLGSPLGLF
jgi:hypothetical protein